MTIPDGRARELSHFMQHYAKQYAAGAFATPTLSELSSKPELVTDFRSPSGRVVIAHRRLTRDSLRHDFTGRKYKIPAGANVVTHITRTPNAPLPDLSEFDAIMAYSEDHLLATQLAAAGRQHLFHRVSAASEVQTCWGRSEYPAIDYRPHDLATAVRVGQNLIGGTTRTLMMEDVALVSSWDDDFPYYSDGSWSAVSLRGFYPDPRKGVKPSEMPKSWKEKHPTDLLLRCDWTSLAAKTPVVQAAVEHLAKTHGFAKLERVRLLKMAGRGGKGGKLGRHTDITDKAAGLADGQIARFHLPLITDPAIRMTIWDLDGHATAHHLPAWTLWYLDARKPHAVANPTGVDRIHLVIDVVADATVRKLISDAYLGSRA
jgi:hypothetical protein